MFPLEKHNIKRFLMFKKKKSKQVQKKLLKLLCTKLLGIEREDLENLIMPNGLCRTINSSSII